jgi:hypothetical protein
LKRQHRSPPKKPRPVTKNRIGDYFIPNRGTRSIVRSHGDPDVSRKDVLEILPEKSKHCSLAGFAEDEDR